MEWSSFALPGPESLKTWGGLHFLRHHHYLPGPWLEVFEINGEHETQLKHNSRGTFLIFFFALFPLGDFLLRLFGGGFNTTSSSSFCTLRGVLGDFNADGVLGVFLVDLINVWSILMREV